jgi:hypothetical protein
MQTRDPRSPKGLGFRPQSQRRATVGFTLAADRPGISVAKSATRISKPVAAAKVAQTGQEVHRRMLADGSKPPSADVELIRLLARLWPHREHESNAVKNLFCRAGLHRWRSLDLGEMVPYREVRFCFWCSKIRVDGVIHEA